MTMKNVFGGKLVPGRGRESAVVCAGTPKSRGQRAAPMGEIAPEC
jgi:hypothetical protein